MEVSPTIVRHCTCCCLLLLSPLIAEYFAFFVPPRSDSSTHKSINISVNPDPALLTPRWMPFSSTTTWRPSAEKIFPRTCVDLPSRVVGVPHSCWVWSRIVGLLRKTRACLLNRTINAVGAPFCCVRQSRGLVEMTSGSSARCLPDQFCEGYNIFGSSRERHEDAEVASSWGAACCWLLYK